MRKSITRAAHDLKVLGRLALVPFVTSGTIALAVLVFTSLLMIDSRRASMVCGSG